MKTQPDHVHVSRTSSGISPELSRVSESELRLCGSWWERIELTAFTVGLVAVPLIVSDPFWVSVLAFAGLAAIAAVSMNLLTGYAGQISLGHAFFLSCGAYAGIYLGQIHELPLVVWLGGAGLVGAAVGALVGPVALRLRGPYLVVVSLGLLFAGMYLFRNWRLVSGGPGGTTVDLSVSVGPVDFEQLSIGEMVFTRSQSMCVLIYLVMGVSLLIVRNLTRSRAGRAMQGVRDDELAAEIVGVSPTRAKLHAFVISSAIAAVSGALLAAQLRYVTPGDFDLFMSIQFITIMVVGGTATTWGPVVGALTLGALPHLIDDYSDSLPFVADSQSTQGFTIAPPQFSALVYGALLVLFLVAAPGGIVPISRSARSAVSRLARHFQP